MATRRRNPTKRRRTNQKGCCKKQKCSHKKGSIKRGGCGTCVGGSMRGGGNPLGFLDPYNNSSIFNNVTNGVFAVPQPFVPWW